MNHRSDPSSDPGSDPSSDPRSDAGTLRSLDPAGALTDADRTAAAVLLERIVATPPGPVGGRRPRVRRLVPIVAAASVLAAGLVVWPRPDDPSAYATWTPVPQPVSGAALDAVLRACREQLDGSLDAGRAEVVLAERRGDHVAILLRTDAPDVSGFCLVRNRPGSTDVSDVRSGAGGSSGRTPVPPPGGFVEGARAQFDGVTITDGPVGRDVTGVTIHAPGGRSVHASVRGGRYVAWWPGPSFVRDRTGTPHSALTFDLVLRDGTVRRDARTFFAR